MKRILILGGGLQQLPAIRHAWKMGWYSIVLDGNPLVLARWEANAFYQVDLKDNDAILALAERLHSEEPLDAVFCVGTDFPVPVAMLAEKLSLPGIPVESALAASNKIAMRRRLQQAGMLFPDFQPLLWSDEHKEESLSRARNFLSEHTLPVVVKPTDNMGARGVRFVSSEQELESALEESAQWSHSLELIIEEKLEGLELSIDALFEQGSCYICCVADRDISLYPYRVELGHSIPTQAGSRDIDAAIQAMKQAAKVFSIQNGAIKGDIAVSNGKAVVIEIAARLSGGFMSGWTCPLSYGIEPVVHAMRIAAGLPIIVSDLHAKRNSYTSERAIISIPGVFSHLEGCEEVWKESVTSNMFLYPSSETRVWVPRNNVEKLGSLIIRGKSREELQNNIRKILSLITIHLIPGDAETESFLFSGSPEVVLGAPLQHADNIRAVHSMLPCSEKLLKKIRFPIPVWKLPDLEKEHTRDWRGVTLQSILEQACSRKYIRFVPRSRPALGSLFWTAVDRGGAQAISYCFDTLRAAKNKREVLCRWQDYLQQ